MNTDFIFDKTKEPDQATVLKVLAESAGLWTEFKSYLIEIAGPVKEEWKFYGQKLGWTMKVLLGKRNLFFMKPGDSFFAIAFVFGDRAVDAASESNLPESVKSSLLDSKKYMEGRGLRLEVKTSVELDIVKKLTEIKLKF